MTAKRQGYGHNVRVAKLAAAAEPVWNELMPAGEWHRKDWGVVNCDRAMFESLIANWKAKGSPELPIDRHHWGSSNEKTVTDPKAKAAVGWIQDLRIAANGNLEGLTEWLPEGREDITAKRFQYFSPEFHEAWPDAATGEREPTLFGGGLLNDPYFLGRIQPLAANDVPDKEQFMTREELIEQYGLPKSATDADIKAAVSAGAAARKAAETAETARKASESRTGELEGDLKKAREANEALEKRTAQLEADVKKAADAAKDAIDKAATESLCAKLEREGRIVAAEKADVAEDVKMLGIEKATARWAKRAQVVPLGERGSPGRGDASEPTPQEAHRQLEEKAAEIRKAGGADAARAYVVACEQNPDLSRAAEKLGALVSAEDTRRGARI